MNASPGGRRGTQEPQLSEQGVNNKDTSAASWTRGCGETEQAGHVPLGCPCLLCDNVDSGEGGEKLGKHL